MTAAAADPDDTLQPGPASGPADGEATRDPTRMHVIGRLIRLSRPVSGRLVLAALLGALAVGSSVGLIATSAWLISRASQQPPVLYLSIAVVGVRAFGIGRAVFRYAERLVSHDAAFRTLTDMRVSIYSRLASNGPVALRPYRRGDLLSRLVADVDSVQDLSLRVLVPVLSGFFVAAGSVALAVWLLPAAGAILAVALMLGGVVVPWLTMVAGSRSAARLAPVQGRMSSEVVDLFSGAADIISCGAARRMVERVEDVDAELTQVQSRGATAAGIAAALGAAAQGAAVVGAVLVAVPAVRSGNLDGVNLAVVVLLPLAAYESVVNLPNAALAMVRVRSGAERVFEVVDAAPAVTEAEHPAPLPVRQSELHAGGSAEAAEPGRTSGLTEGSTATGGRRIEVRGLAAQYPGADRDAVYDANFTLVAGQTTALVGPSGAGKSTVAAVLERFLDYRGSVTLDGVEIADLDSDQVRTVIGLCAQDAHVFDTSIGENIRLANRAADDAAVMAALDAARLGDWVAAQPDGLNTPVGMHGAALSGGQRQRLALARALIADFDVLILDEPTEHLDVETAESLMADLRHATRGKAVLLITHRPADAAAADHVVEVTA